MALRAPSGLDARTIAELAGYSSYQTMMSELSGQPGHKLGADKLLPLMETDFHLNQNTEADMSVDITPEFVDDLLSGRHPEFFTTCSSCDSFLRFLDECFQPGRSSVPDVPALPEHTKLEFRNLLGQTLLQVHDACHPEPARSGGLVR
jgi:hypothetical protein